MGAPALPVLELTGSDAVLGYNDGTGSSYTPFASVVEMTGNKITAPEVKTTVLTSAAQKSQAGVPDYGEFAAKIKFQPAVTTLIMGWVAAKKTVDFEFTDDAGNYLSFQGWVKELDPYGAVKEDQRIESSISIKITDVITFHAAS